MVFCVNTTEKGPFLIQYFKKYRKLLEAVCNIIISFRWQVTGEKELPHVALKFQIF
jgi:hypothetical protein